MLETHEMASDARRSCGESRSNVFRPGDRRSNNYSVGAQIESASEVRRGFYPPLQNHGNGTLANQRRQQIPRRAHQASAGWCVASERGGNRIGSGGDCLSCLLDSGDVGEHRQIKLALDAPHKHRPRFAKWGLSVSAVDCDDRGARFGQGSGRSKISGDIDLVRVIALAQADDWFFRKLAKGANIVDAFAAKATCATTQHRGSDSAERDRVIKWIAFRRLAGDDQAVTQLFWKDQSEITPVQIFRRRLLRFDYNLGGVANRNAPWHKRPKASRQLRDGHASSYSTVSIPFPKAS
jgi:hypothetical protein